jgi:hypothetical protein
MSALARTFPRNCSMGAVGLLYASMWQTQSELRSVYKVVRGHEVDV